MRKYRDAKHKILAVVLALFTVVTTMSSSITTLAGTYTGIGDNIDAYVQSGGSIAQVFTAQTNYEKLNSVSFKVNMSEGQAVTYTVKIYENLTNNANPESGQLRYSTTASLVDVDGDQLIQVDIPATTNIYLAQGETFSAVATLSSSNPDKVSYYTNTGSGNGYKKDLGSGWVEKGASIMDAATTNVDASAVNDITNIAVSPASSFVDISDDDFKLTTTLTPAYLRKTTYTSKNGIVLVDNEGNVSLGSTTGADVIEVTADGTSAKATANITVLKSEFKDGTDGFVYAASGVAPEVEVTCGSKLTKGQDYMVTYAGNTGITNGKTATATVSGMGSYAGYKKVLYFEINSAEITQEMVDAGTFRVNTSTGVVESTSTIGTLRCGTDFSAQAEKISTNYTTNEITYRITVTGKGNYYTAAPLTTTCTMTASKDNLIDISSLVEVQLNPDTCVYDSEDKKPEVEFYDFDGGKISGFKNNCIINYKDNKEAGTGIVTIKGDTSKGYTGTITKEFAISRCNLKNNSKISLDIVDGSSYFIHKEGGKFEPEIDVRLTTDSGSSYELISGKDYTVKYLNNSEIGTMKIQVVGMGNFLGTYEKQMEIIGDFEKDAVVTIGSRTATYSDNYATAYSTEYTGNPKNPSINVVIGSDQLVQDQDYVIDYADADHTNVGTVSVNIVGRGQYAGKSIVATYKISAKSLSGATLNIFNPAREYTGSKIELQSGDYSLTRGSTTTYTPETDYTLSYKNNIEAGTATVTATGCGNYTGTVTATFTINPMSINDGNISLSYIEDQKYTGKAITPTVKVYYGADKELPTSCYDVKYENNTDIGTATVKVIGKGNLTGTRTVNFEIKARDFNGISVTVGGATANNVGGKWVSNYKVEYNGYEQEPLITIMDGTTKLTPFTHYTCSFGNNTGASTADKPAKIYVSGMGAYSGSVMVIEFTIEPRDISNEKITTTVSPEINNYTEAETGYVLPTVLVMDNAMVSSKRVLQLGTSYKVVGNDDCKTSGKDKEAKIVGIGNYTGERTVSYSIGKDLEEAAATTITIKNPYTGATIEPKDGIYYIPYMGEEKPEISLTYKGMALKEGATKDFVTTYETTSSDRTKTIYDADNTNPIQVTCKGVNGYYGEVKIEYYLLRAALSTDRGVFTVTNNDATHPDFTYEFDGEGKDVDLKVTYNVGDDAEEKIVLVKGKDYTLSKESISSEIGQSEVVITGIGNYQGEIRVLYKVEKADITNASRYELAAIVNQIYTGEEICPDVSLKDKTTGYVLKNKTDYVLEYENNVDVSTGAVDAKVTIRGTGKYTGTREAHFNIVKRDLATIQIADIDDQVFTGNPIEPSIFVSYGGNQLTKGDDYTVFYSNNTNPGMAKITITGTGTYTGTKEVNFKIVGDLSNKQLFTVSGVQESYNLQGGNLNFTELGISVKYINDQQIEAFVDTSNYSIEKIDCDTPGRGQIIFVGKNFCKGSQSVPINVIGNLSDATAVNVENVNNAYGYTGRKIEPKPIVTYGNQTLREDVDYTVEYGDNKNAGATTGYISVISKPGSFYTGNWSKHFAIQYDLTGAKVEGVAEYYDYTGSKIEPRGISVTCGDQTLSESEYQITYGENTSAGQGTVTITPMTGVSYVTGSKTVTFDIKGIKLTDTTITLDGQETGLVREFTGDNIKPEVVVTYASKTLKEGTDYIISGYDKNVNVGEAKVIIRGTGNYEGQVAKTFTIQPVQISKVDITVANMGYAGGNPVIPDMQLTYNSGNYSLQKGVDFTFEVKQNTAVTTSAYVKFYGTGNFTGEALKYFEVTKTDLAGGTINIENSSAGYSGSVIRPKVTVTCPVGDGTNYTLRENVDYEIEYNGAGDIKDAGLYNITVTGKDNFYNSLYTNFEVLAKPIDGEDIRVTVTDMDWTGSSVTPTVTVKDVTRDIILEEGTDYRVVLENNTDAASKDDTEAAPTAEIIGLNNYGGTRAETFNIGKSIESAELRLATSKYTYDGNSHVPAFSVYLGEDLLEEDVDYVILPVEDSVNAGTKTVAVRGKGNYYGIASKEYVIKQKVAASDKIRVVLELPKDEKGNYYQVYNGEPVIPVVHVYDDEISTTEPLREADYGLDYINNTKAGDAGNPAYVKVSLKGNYDSGSETKHIPFVIRKRNIEETFTMTLDPTRCVYNGIVKTPEVTVSFEDEDGNVLTLVDGVDYDVTYENNVNAGEAKAIVEAKGNYEGTLVQTFDIYASLLDANVTIATQFYTGEAVEPIVDVVCGGNKLVKDVDYTIRYFSEDNYQESGYVLIEPKSKYYSDSIQKSYVIRFDESLLQISGYAKEYVYTGQPIRPEFVVTTPSGMKLDYDPTQIKYENTTAKGTVVGDCISAGTVTATIPIDVGTEHINITVTYKIVQKKITSCTIKQLVNNTYTGKKLTPPVTIMYGNYQLVSGKDYTVTYSNNVNPGSASVAVKGIGNFSGSTTLHFNILPTGMVKLTAAPASTSSIKLTWATGAKVTGYQVYSSDGKKRYGNTTGNAYTVTGLKAASVYTFKVRSYVTVNGKTSYGAFTTVKANTKVAAVNLSGKSKSKGTATLTWAKNQTVTGYEIYRSTSAKGTYKKVASMPNSKVSYTDKSLKSKKTYYYKIRGYKKVNGKYIYGSFSKVVKVTVQ